MRFESDAYFHDNSWTVDKARNSVCRKMKLTERGCIDLSRVSHIAIPEVSKDESLFPFDFAIDDERNIKWLASSSQEREEWISQLDQSINQENNSEVKLGFDGTSDNDTTLDENLEAMV